MTRLGILTGGGDAPGLNAVIRAVVKSAVGKRGWSVVGIKNGFEGLLAEDGFIELTSESVRGILPRGGTILGAANRGNPFARRIIRAGKEIVLDESDQVLHKLNQHGIDCLIVVGGDGTLRISLELFDKGCPIIGVPKTIDNDIDGTEVTFGFDTAVGMATEAIDRLHTTAEAHHRVMVLELMGRDAGFITLQAGVAGGADIILIPEIPFLFEPILNKIRARSRGGRHFSIVAVAEGAHPSGSEQVYLRLGPQSENPRLGGVGAQVAEVIARECEVEARVTVLGHLQRGGSPTAFDRWLASRFGAAAVRLAEARKYGRMVALKGGDIVDITLLAALAVPKRVDQNSDAVVTARDLGICFGEDEVE